MNALHSAHSTWPNLALGAMILCTAVGSGRISHNIHFAHCVCVSVFVFVFLCFCLHPSMLGWIYAHGVRVTEVMRCILWHMERRQSTCVSSKAFVHLWTFLYVKDVTCRPSHLIHLVRDDGCDFRRVCISPSQCLYAKNERSTKNIPRNTSFRIWYTVYLYVGVCHSESFWGSSQKRMWDSEITRVSLSGFEIDREIRLQTVARKYLIYLCGNFYYFFRIEIDCCID